MTYDGTFFEKNLQNVFEKDIVSIKSIYDKNQLFTHTSKLSSGVIQIVLVSGTEYDDDIDKIAQALHGLLIERKYLSNIDQ